MKRIGEALIVSLALVCLSQPAAAQTAGNPKGAPGIHWWNEPFHPAPAPNPNAKKLPLISVKGNTFVDPQGNTVVFRGLAIADIDKVEGGGHWNRDFFVHVQSTGARIVRIPVHPIAWRERTPQRYLELLDQAVDWCTELGMYVDLDWHSIGNLKQGLYQDPMYVTTMDETFQFWRTVSVHFAGNNTVVFFELFNEPTTWSGRLGRTTWDEWKRINEDLITLVRANDPQVIPLVAGLDWAYDLTPLHDNPIEAEGIGYTVHPYAHKRQPPWEPKWEEDFGFAAGKYPVVATEFGYGSAQNTTEAAAYGPAITKYLEGKGMSWIVWVYDADWRPGLLKSWDTFELTDSGAFFSQAMKGNVK